jgi:hypothetical protein
MMMFRYSFINIATKQKFACIAPCFANACRQQGQNPLFCRVLDSKEIGNVQVI